VHETSSTATARTETGAAQAERAARRGLGCAIVSGPGRTLAALVATGLLSGVLSAACGSTRPVAARPVAALDNVHHIDHPTTSVPSTTTTTAPPAPPTPAAPPTSVASPGPAFVGTVAPVTAAQVPATWRPGCPMGPDQLSMLTMSYWGLDGLPHVGTMVIATSVTSAVLHVFAQLYAEHFPIHQMQPQDAYGGHDPVSMSADNTSGFNCRYAVASGPPSWSVHAYGEAIDVNPVENPYLEGGQVQPPEGAPYLNRSDVRPGMAVPGGQLVQAFAAVGWSWGGRWASSPDYQHFSATGG
jgi:hypothetical protein